MWQIIPEPRAINQIKSNLEKDRYKDPQAAYNDLALVFWNAIYYNEEDSPIFMDAEDLKVIINCKVFCNMTYQVCTRMC